jgi:hypothetical protein
MAAVVGRRRPELPLLVTPSLTGASAPGASDAVPGNRSQEELMPDGVPTVNRLPRHHNVPPEQWATTPASLATCPPELAALIRSCWQQRELRRPTAAEVHGALRRLLALAEVTPRTLEAMAEATPQTLEADRTVSAQKSSSCHQ